MSNSASSSRPHDRAAARLTRAARGVELLEGRRLLSAAAPYVPGELLVAFEPGVGQGEIAQVYRQHGLSELEALDRHAGKNTRSRPRDSAAARIRVGRPRGV